jgi:hypothetical protein
LDKELDKVADKVEKSAGIRRKRSPAVRALHCSQDPNDLLRIRKKRSTRNYIPDISLEGNESPNYASMTLLDSSKNKNLVVSQEPNLSFKNKLNPTYFNSHKKQDKSKVLKYSPFQKREMDIQSKRKNYSKARKSMNSNSFLGSMSQQTASYAVKKGNKSQKRKKKPALSGALGLLHQASFAKAKAKENDESGVEKSSQKCPSNFTQIEEVSKECSEKVSDAVMQEENILQEREANMEAPQKVFVYNTPVKSQADSE